MKTRVYISGQITGLTEDVFRHLFNEAEKLLIGWDAEPVNPCTLNHNHDKSWKEFMREDLKALKTCERLFALTNWQNSRGARIEVWFAHRYGIPVMYEGSYNAHGYKVFVTEKLFVST